MNLENIDEAEAMIEKLRIVQAAEKQITKMLGDDGGRFETFELAESDTQIAINLPNLKAEVLSAIKGVLNDQHEKIVERLRKI